MLYEIKGVVGTPLLIDNVTKNRLFGHYARVLVDLDLSKENFYEVLVEREVKNQLISEKSGQR